MAIIIISRELIISAFRQIAAANNFIMAADMWGKIKANFQFFATLLFMIFSYFIGAEYAASLRVLCTRLIRKFFPFGR